MIPHPKIPSPRLQNLLKPSFFPVRFQQSLSFRKRTEKEKKRWMCFSTPTPRSHQIPSRIEGKEKQGEMWRWGKKGMDVVTLPTPKKKRNKTRWKLLVKGKEVSLKPRHDCSSQCMSFGLADV